MTEAGMDRRGPWAGSEGAELARAWGVPRVETYTRIGSTNDRAAELARSGGPTPAVVVAEEQTAGRGRRGAAWRSRARAGVWMSILLGPERGHPVLPLVVGVAVARAVERVAGPGPSVRLKWPNDLLVDDLKVGGILCEADPAGVVVGIGVDVGEASIAGAPELHGVATALEVVWGKSIGRSDLASAIVAEVLGSTEGDDPLDAVRDELARRDALLGRAVVTEAYGPGVAAGIGPDGALLLELPDGTRRPVVSGGVRLAPNGTSV